MVNTGGTQGGTGLSTGLDIALTLGCGTWGGSSMSENVGPQHLINVKRVANGTIEPDELIAKDELFALYHPELAHGRSSSTGTEMEAEPAPASEPTPTPVSGISYSPGCGCCAAASENRERPSDVIGIDELKDMIEQLVGALKSA